MHLPNLPESHGFVSMRLAKYIVKHGSTVHSHTKATATHTLTHSHTRTHTHTHTHTHTCTQDGYFPLYDASQKGYDGIVEMLLQAGATVNLQTKVEDCGLTLLICHVLCSLYTTTPYSRPNGKHV